jgi:hypothetical protein
MNAVRVLQVQGRHTGRPHDIPLLVTTWNNQRFVVSLFGESQWCRNLRASGEAYLLVRGSREKVRAREILGHDKQVFLGWYLRQRGNQITVPRRRGTSPSAVSPAGIEIERLASRYPIFRLGTLS